ncbi:MAG TPA: hypothetical protein VHW60_22695 [Caulobacteraceae bacterium]|jgi:hypothetical protein|nr:hypothetical protein [Caulobacteraceae bacterium]
MFKASLIVAALLLIPASALAAGTVTKYLRPTLNTFDSHGQPLGPVSASDLKAPTPIVANGVGGSVGIIYKGKTIFLRGLDVQTTGVNVACAPVQGTARNSGSSYAATNMGLGGAADCTQH